MRLRFHCTPVRPSENARSHGSDQYQRNFVVNGRWRGYARSMIKEICAALQAFEFDFVADPEQRPNGPTEDDIPQMLGVLAAVVDLQVLRNNLTNPQRLIEFNCGYSIVIPNSDEYHDTLVRRGAFASLLAELGPFPGAHTAGVLKE